MTIALILGAAVWPDGPSPTLARRTRAAIALWESGAVSAIVCCGGLGRHPPAEAVAMQAILRAAGVPEEAILIEDRSTTTVENLRLALPLLRARGDRRVIIVTDWYHAPRARMIARRLGLEAQSLSLPPDRARPLAQARQALREIPAVAVALWRLRRG